MSDEEMVGVYDAYDHGWLETDENPRGMIPRSMFDLYRAQWDKTEQMGEAIGDYIEAAKS